MQVYLDGRPLPESGTTLAQALQSARRASPGRLVIEVLADGAPVSAADLANPPLTSPFADELFFTTAEPASLARDTLNGATTALDRLQTLQAQAAEMAQTGRTDRALEDMKTVIGQWQSVRTAATMVLDLLREVGADVAAPERDLNEAARQLAGDLAGLARSIGREDWSNFADTLEFDLGATAKRWMEAFSRLEASLG